MEMNILFVASEAVPIIKTGGLADVIGALPKELQKHGIDVRVMIPKYGEIPLYLQQGMKFLMNFRVQVGWRDQSCGVWMYEDQGIIFYLIENKFYFERDGLYGHDDDAERFAYFCRAVLEAIGRIDFKPDILHCHDWHTGLIPLFLEAHYRLEPPFQKIKTLYTIHNLEYQGVFPKTILEDLLHLTEEYFTGDRIEYYDQVNYMKAGLVYATHLTTVSPSYAGEILTSYYGEGHATLLCKRKESLHGILNGLDYESYNPTTDPQLFRNYSIEKMQHKAINKRKLQKLVGLPLQGRIPLFGLVSRLVHQKGLDLIAPILDRLMEKDIQLIVIGRGEKIFEQVFKNLADKYPDKVSIHLLFHESLARKIYAGADMFLMPSKFEPCGIGQLIAMRYGTVPIVRATGGLKDTVHTYNQLTGEGNGFSFPHYNAEELLETISKGISYYHQPEIWQKIRAAGMKCQYSWTSPAKQYVGLYQKLLE